MSTAILWFRHDLRLTDNSALQAAINDCSRLFPLYIHAPEEEAPWEPGSASRWWLSQSLDSLHQNLKALDSGLHITSGPSLEALLQIAAQYHCTRVYWNRLYEPALAMRDAKIKKALEKKGIHCSEFNASLLHEPWEILTGKGTPYRVFTPYWRACMTRREKSPSVTRAPRQLPPLPDGSEPADPSILSHAHREQDQPGMAKYWQPGEAGALDALLKFLNQGVGEYASQRELPAIHGTSRLSPHLHFGEIGPRQILAGLEAQGRGELLIADGKSGPSSFLRELGWRDFAHYLLHHFPETSDKPFDSRFEEFPWRWANEATAELEAWQQGLTGIPLIDAGMRELQQTGWMHNRVRMIVASFLTKNLRIHWLEGARWFWDRLVDADLASNSLGWQWSAGCGADAAPFFRVFNPVRQSERFDPNGVYLRRWLPELQTLPNRLIHAPWRANSNSLREHSIELGRDYPPPIVELDQSRQSALAHWKALQRFAQAS